MIDWPGLSATLAAEDLGGWGNELEPRVNERLADGAHGDLKRWRAAIDGLPRVAPQDAVLDADTVGVPHLQLERAQSDALRSKLLELSPWRKGPFAIGEVFIDAEWRSNLKWDRVKTLMSPLSGRLVLDVGCGNGYYALRMLGAGARAVIGTDPTLIYVSQFEAIRRFMTPLRAHLLPLRLEALAPVPACFDTVFSMGVLYHQRAPIDHLRTLRAALDRNGELILETLLLPGDETFSRTPEGRYARMRNVWHLPTASELAIWLTRAGFKELVFGAVALTTIDEQRATEWMPFESLSEALDPADPALTVEGWPAPLRVVVRAEI